MKEIVSLITPASVMTMPKADILSTLTQSHDAAKPLNNNLVEISLKIHTLTSEIYRRSIGVQLPGIPFTRIRTVLKINSSVNPSNGLPQIAARLIQLKEEGVRVVSVHYDENTGEFHFLAEPEFPAPKISTP